MNCRHLWIGLTCFLIRRCLASPRYGERWARHWLDVAHYADTHGNDHDYARPNAWPYRDYLIDARKALPRSAIDSGEE